VLKRVLSGAILLRAGAGGLSEYHFAEGWVASAPSAPASTAPVTTAGPPPPSARNSDTRQWALPAWPHRATAGPQVEQLLAKSYAALAPGGTIVVHGAHIHAAKTGPLPVAAYSALLMTISEGKCYSEQQKLTGRRAAW